MEYIDQNPVKAGLVQSMGDWKASGAYYIRHGLSGLVDYTELTRLSYVRQLPNGAWHPSSGTLPCVPPLRAVPVTKRCLAPLYPACHILAFCGSACDILSQS
jgi:hypothetical protein